MIELLASTEGHVLEREEIYSRLWGYTMVRGDRSVDVFVRKLRQKLERASPHWRYIHTHFGVGYRFSAEPLDGVVPLDVAVPLDAATPFDKVSSIDAASSPGAAPPSNAAPPPAKASPPRGHRVLA